MMINPINRIFTFNIIGCQQLVLFVHSYHQLPLFKLQQVFNQNSMKITLKHTSQLSQDPSLQHRLKQRKPTGFQLKQYQPDGICERLAFMLIRPPRFLYNPSILDPAKRNTQRFTLQHINIGFELSLYKQSNMRYVILYLHGNGSSRLEGCLFLPSLPPQVGLACFDFNGCGNREEADYITLGQNQSKDADKAAKYLKQLGYIVVGWGRSMGAVSLLKSSECDIMVTDSAYSNLSQLCKETSSKFLPEYCCCLFNLFFPCVFSCIKCKVEAYSGLQISEMDIVQRMRKLSGQSPKKSICFIHAGQDTLIPDSHSQKLYDAFEGRKMLLKFDGTHNSTRPEEVIEKCFQFIEECLESPADMPHSRLPQNIKLNKMVEMEEMDKGMSQNDKKTSTGSKQHKQPSKSPKKQKIKEEYVYLQTQYSNVPSNHGSHLGTQSKEQNNSQLGQKIRMDLNDHEIIVNKPVSFQLAAKQPVIHLFHNSIDSPTSHIRKQLAIEKIFRQK